MKIIKILLVLFSLFIAGIVLTSLSQPEEYQVEATQSYDLPVEILFNRVADFEIWPQWSPWSQKDPQMKRIVSKPSMGQGAEFSWESKTQGKGTQLVEDFKVHEKIQYKLKFDEPFKSEAKATFVFKKIDTLKTQVTWQMTGKNETFIQKVAYGLLGVNKMIKKDFELGLQRLGEMK